MNAEGVTQSLKRRRRWLRGRVWGIRWDPFFVHYLSFEALSSRHLPGLNATTAPGWTFLSLTWFNVTLWLNRAVGVFLTLWYALNCSSPLRKMLFRTRWFRGRGDNACIHTLVAVGQHHWHGGSVGCGAEWANVSPEKEFLRDAVRVFSPISSPRVHSCRLRPRFTHQLRLLNNCPLS